MMDQQPIADGEPQAVASAEPGGNASDNEVQPSAGNPYLRVFGPDIAAFECELSRNTTSIGRLDNAHVTLPNRGVSRIHATIARDEGQFVLTDNNSTSGTSVNGRPVERHVLQHGDSIRIGTYMLQFQTRRTDSSAEEAAARARLLLRSEFSVLPSTVRLRYRTLTVEPSGLFESGDTLKMGRGGLLIPTSTPPEEDDCLELHLLTGERAGRQFIGSIMGVIPSGGEDWMCVKLHSLPKEKHEAFVAGAEVGPWIDIEPS